MRLPVLALALIAASAGSAAPVPFVGCASDGQQGAQPAPRPGPVPDVPPYAAGKLAYYRMADGTAVLAPRGWHCFGTYGSNGSTLLVTPQPLDWRRATAKTGITGPAVQLSLSSGGTSGRFEVAAIATRLFPAARGFVDRVEAEGLTDEPFVRRTAPTDKVTHRGPYEALFTTPANRKGLGTTSHLASGPLAIDGVAILHPESDMDLTMLTARLPAAIRPLVAPIIAKVAQRR